MSAAPQLAPLPIKDRPRLRPENRSRIGIGHSLVDQCSFVEAKERILDYAEAGGSSAYVLTPNAQHVVLLHSDHRLRQIYREADLSVPDGVSILLAAWLLGRTVPERVAGVDLFRALCEDAAQRGLRVFFLGGRPGSADLAASRLRESYPNLNVATHCPKVGFEADSAEVERIATKINSFQPHLLFVGFGAPKQEYWIYERGRHLAANVCLGIGGAFEMIGGVVPRAPKLLQQLALEWLFRLALEPRRMWRRYLIGNSQFLAIVVNQRLARSLFRILVQALKNAPFNPQIDDPQTYRRAVQLLTRDSEPNESISESLKEMFRVTDQR
jgi:N-acetylglucosaminyldiphosphoundecaprenol N-acetyl-beta-D-mannosaminyltransferase